MVKGISIKAECFQQGIDLRQFPQYIISTEVTKMLYKDRLVCQSQMAR